MNLNEQIEELFAQNADDFLVAKTIKNEINSYYKNLDDKFKTNQGKDFLVKHTKQIDNILKYIYKFVIRKTFKEYAPFSNQIPISLIALGSYGREQLCLYSDIDLMIVYEKIDGYNVISIIETILQIAWDCGLDLAHRVHHLDDIFLSSKSDHTIKSSFLESRFIYGSSYLFSKVKVELNKISIYEQKKFVISKLDEFNKRHTKDFLTMEPNIKEDIGGLRDANTLFWLANIKYRVKNLKELLQLGHLFGDEEYKIYRASLEFIFRVRSALHFSVGKKQDRLLFDYIPDVASKLSIKGDRYKTKESKLMKLVFLNMSNIYRFCIKYIEIISKDILKNNITSSAKKDIFIYQDRLYFVGKNDKKDTKALLLILLNTKDLPFKIDISFNKVTYNIKKSILDDNLKNLFLNIFKREYSYSILLFLYKNSILEYFVKEFKQIKFLAQFDGYHQRPVCFHSIKSIYHIENIEDENIYLAYQKLSKHNRFLLKLALFFHDFGKGKIKDHSILGSEIFKSFGDRFNLKLEDIATIRTIIRYHTLMSSTAIKEDIYNEKVIFSFVSYLKNKTIIDMIYILTYADIKGTSEALFTSHTSKLLFTLYKASIEAVENKKLVEESSRRRRKEQAILNDEKFKKADKIIKNKILKIDSNLLFLKYSKNQIIELVNFAINTKRFDYKITNKDFLNIEIIRVTPLNLGYLLGKLSFLDIINMDIFRLFDDKKFFHIEFSSRVEANQIEDIKQIVKNSFDMKNSTNLKIPTLKKSDIKIDCNHSHTLAKMQINTKNEHGLFAYIAKLFDDFGVEIESAKIYTQKNRAKDLFLIEKNGNFCKNRDEIIKKLIKRTSKIIKDEELC